MDINDNLKKLREQKHRFVERGKLANKRLEEMRLASNSEFIERYKLKKYNSYLRVDALNKKIDEICETIEYCSYFDSEQIGPIICDLINLFEGEKFVYQSKRYYPNTKEAKVKCIKLIVLDDRKQDEWYDERYVNSLVKKGNAIVLTKAEAFWPHLDIYFYAYDELHRVNQNISFGAFPYVKEFIDGVIQYKMNNKEQKHISTEELKKLEIEFIKSRLEQIKKNYEFTDDRRTQAFLLSLEHNKIVRNRQLQKVLNRYNQNENQN